jgi:large subunit ribosomal protein L23
VYSIIKRPLFTEKGAALKEHQNQVLLEVARGANKIDIKKAVEEIFKVKVEKVTTIKLPGKVKRWGKSSGMTSVRKKALVTLKKGEKLDFIEGA